GAAQLEPAVAAARGHAAARRDRLHDAHVGLDLVRARLGDLAVDVEHRRAVDVYGLTALQQVALADEGDLLVLAVARHEDGLGAGRGYGGGSRTGSAGCRRQPRSRRRAASWSRPAGSVPASRPCRAPRPGGSSPW